MLKEKFIGVWELISVESIYSNGDIVPTFKEPKGILIYEPNNIVVVQVSGEYTDEALEKSPMKLTKEAEKKIPTFRAYWGKYEINEKECIVSHHILGGSEQVSSLEEREFAFEGACLILKMKDKPWMPKGSVSQLRWRRWH